MKQPLIKITKRCAETVIQAAQAAETGNEPEVLESSVKTARFVRREMVKTITGWIEDWREQRRLAEITARRKPVGEPFMGEE